MNTAKVSIWKNAIMAGVVERKIAEEMKSSGSWGGMGQRLNPANRQEILVKSPMPNPLIAIPEDVKEELDSMKVGDESYGSVLRRALDKLRSFEKESSISSQELK